MSETLRAFWAVELPPAARQTAVEASEAIEAVRGEAPDAVRWLPVENLHLTVKFLGDVPSDRIPKLLHAAAGRLVREAPFEVALGGLGAFPSARAARVLWLGVSEGVAELARLARKLDAAASRIGVPREKRPYRAHLTLARLRTPARVAIERAVAPACAPFPVQEVVLFQSHLGPTGSSYVPLARLPLGEAAAYSTDFAP